jgi:ABC-type multidrug transport system fused ATPase/permease subunit
MREEVESACIWFVVVGVARGLAQTLQFFCFGVIGEALTKRVRVSILKKICEMEIGFHDDPANTPGKLLKSLEL